MTGRYAGFTLLEVLIVITIMAVLTSLVMLNFTGADQRQRHEGAVERLALRLDLARQRAVQRNRELGFQLALNTYEFYELDTEAGTWRTLAARPLAAGTFAQDVIVTLRVEGGGETRLRREGGEDDDAYENADQNGGSTELPDLVFFRSGELTPFELRYELAGGGRVWTIMSDGLSPIRMAEAEDS